MHTKDEVYVWPNSHPRGGGGYIHSSSMKDHANHKHPIMLAQNKNTEDIRQVVRHDGPHRINPYDDINLMVSLQSTQHKALQVRWLC